jgi:hypothetical protein
MDAAVSLLTAERRMAISGSRVTAFSQMRKTNRVSCSPHSSGLPESGRPEGPSTGAKAPCTAAVKTCSLVPK